MILDTGDSHVIERGITEGRDGPDIRSMDFERLQQFVKEWGEKPFRAGQIYDWLHRQLVQDPEEMTNLPAALRQRLREECSFGRLHIIREQVSAVDGTRKYLMELSDGNRIESVWMKYRHGNSVCVSSQVGCRMGCRFCASTVGGLVRSLAPSEMLGQVYEISRNTGERVSHVIIMGMGEPLDNFENVIRFIRMLSDERGLHISQRNITLSTCGLVPGIYDLMKEDLAITLAVSLHAPDDVLRRRMMPVANQYSVAEIMQACRDYVERTGRRVTFEYTLVQNVNDSPECAGKLIRLLKGLNCHVNLIPLNSVRDRMGKRSRAESVQCFRELLEKGHIPVTVRRELGSDIDAACGQLRRKNDRESCKFDG